MIKEERESNTEYGWKQELRDQGINVPENVTEGIVGWEDEELRFGKDEVSFDLEFEYHNSNLTDEFVVVNMNEIPPIEFANTSNLFVMYNDDNEMLVSVDLDSGDVEFGESYTPDEAARTFWNTINNYNNYKIQQQESLYEEYQEVQNILRDVRHNLEVPEAESIIEWSKDCVYTGDGARSSEERVKVISKDAHKKRFNDSMKGLIDG